MAEKSAGRTLVSSIHSDDLLSDMELLPASAPPTPMQKAPRQYNSPQSATPYTSKVTTQLYASLQQSRQAEAQARSHLEGQHGSGLAREAEVDLDTLAEEMSHRLSTSVETSAYRKAGAAESHHIVEMESVRCHLQSMLRGSREAAHGDAAALGTFERKDDDSFESDSTGALLNARPLQEVSPPGSVAGFEELFPRYTSLHLGQLREHSTYADTHLLKDCLDKEQARRKHCERHIQTLQNRILELQQQLAVAVSADRKKDSMIEQLDKTLAKVVDGWNRHEAERTSALRRLQTEKEAAEQALGREKEKGAETEGRLEQALSALSREQQTASLCRREKEALEEEKASLSCSVEAERQRVRSLEVEWDLERRQQETLRATLEEQQKAWAQRERQLEQQRQTLQEDSRAQLDKERAAAHREAQKVADTQRVLASVQSEVQGMEAELEAVRRERDNLKMEISLVKARHEAQKVKLESELKVALEQRVTERLAEVHEESLRQLSAMREQHRKQLLDLSSHHEKELASQLAQFKSDLAEKEERQRHLTEDYERRISRQQGEIRELQSKHRRLEVQRAEMVSQFQTLMQAHWNEALRLFAGSTASPQPCAKGPRPDPPSDPDLAPDLDCLQPSDSLKKMPKRPSEAPEKAVQGTNQLFLPLTPDVGRLSSEFSHILSCSLLSQPGFQPLEPQEDHPRIDSGLTFHPENLAEHPFTDEIDETVTEAVGSEAETPQHSSLDSGGQAPQPDFSYYLRLLLDHASNESCAQKQEGSSANSLPPFTNQTQFGTSHSYHERSTALWDTAQPSTNTIRIQPPSNAAVHKTKVSLSKAGSSYPEATSPLQQDLVHQSGILSPRQVAEVSRLLKHYQAKGKPVPSTEELYKYLRGIDQNGPEMKSDGNLQARRNLDPRLTEGVRKEVGPARRLGPGREKSHPSAKAGRKLSGVPASNSRHSRGGGGVWR